MTAISLAGHGGRDAIQAPARGSHGDELTPAETAALSSIRHLIRSKRILNLGVGTGRTVRALRQYSRDYVGVDHAPEMVAHCRTRFPFVRFDQVDARSMPQYADGSFDVVVFLMNGICMVDEAGRLKILREVRRVLSPGGVFVFSTFNRAGDGHVRFAHSISLQDQGRQLEDAGFLGDKIVFDLAGKEVTATADDSMMFVVRPSAAPELVPE